MVHVANAMHEIELADVLHHQATELAAALPIIRHFQGKGSLVFTGSYALNLMTWRDLDIQIHAESIDEARERFTDEVAVFSRDPRFREAQLIRFDGDYKPKMPRGVYLGLQVHSNELGGTWKVDIWCLSPEDFSKNRDLIQKIQDRLTPELRQLILSWKHRLMGSGTRMPQMGSHWIYQALVLENLREPSDILAYLSSHGVQV